MFESLLRSFHDRTGARGYAAAELKARVNELRNDIADKLAVLVTTDDTIRNNIDSYGVTPAEYVDMVRNKLWGGDPELAAFARLHPDTKMIILEVLPGSQLGREAAVYNKTAEGEAMYLVYRRAMDTPVPTRRGMLDAREIGCHYNPGIVYRGTPGGTVPMPPPSDGPSANDTSNSHTANETLPAPLPPLTQWFNDFNASIKWTEHVIADGQVPSWMEPGLLMTLTKMRVFALADIHYVMKNNLIMGAERLNALLPAIRHAEWLTLQQVVDSWLDPLRLPIQVRHGRDIITNNNSRMDIITCVQVQRVNGQEEILSPTQVIGRTLLIALKYILVDRTAMDKLCSPLLQPHTAWLTAAAQQYIIECYEELSDMKMVRSEYRLTSQERLLGGMFLSYATSSEVWMYEYIGAADSHSKPPTIALRAIIPFVRVSQSISLR
jgi:hypothetical protein